MPRKNWRKCASGIQPLIEDEVRKQLIAQAKTDLQKTELDVETFKEQSDQLGKEVDKYGNESHQIGRSSVDLEMMKADVENVEKISKEMATEIETLRIELASASPRGSDQPGRRAPGARRKIAPAASRNLRRRVLLRFR